MYSASALSTRGIVMERSHYFRRGRGRRFNSSHTDQHSAVAPPPRASLALPLLNRERGGAHHRRQIHKAASLGPAAARVQRVPIKKRRSGLIRTAATGDTTTRCGNRIEAEQPRKLLRALPRSAMGGRTCWKKRSTAHYPQGEVDDLRVREMLRQAVLLTRRPRGRSRQIRQIRT
jgi:hypothetical protein